jgi:hypothetical protein
VSAYSLEVTPEGWIARLLRLRQSWLAIDANPQARAFIGTGRGLVLLHAAFIAALAISLQVSLPALALVSLTLCAAAAFPHRRLAVLLVSSLVFLMLRPFRTQEFTQLLAELAARPGVDLALPPMALQFAGVLAFLLFARAAMAGLRHGGALWQKRPVLVQLTGFMACLAIAAHLEPGHLVHTALWTLVAVWASCFWFLAYAAVDQKAKLAQSDTVRALYMRPVWGGDVAPIGKGLSFLSRFEARDQEALAATRLKALKLAVWTAILSWTYQVLAAVLHGALGVPRLGAMILGPDYAASLPLTLRWAGLFANYALDLLIIAAWGHAVVAIVRMMGYAIPRNTVNPMASRSIAEFWNRYYYYFKEVLVDFFFYPAFVRFFKSSPRLRIAFATFCAAGIGNFLYHLIFASHVFAKGSPALELDRFVTLAFYVCMLSAGLIASQIWGRKSSPADGVWRHDIRPRMQVILFFCFLKIFDSVWLEGDLSDRFTFLFGLFGA